MLQAVVADHHVAFRMRGEQRRAAATRSRPIHTGQPLRRAEQQRLVADVARHRRAVATRAARAAPPP